MAGQQVEVVAGAPGAARQSVRASPSRRSPRCSRCCRSTAPGSGAASRVTFSRASASTSARIDGSSWVGGAGEQEVLPDQQAEFVGEVVEVVGLVDAAAPDPQQVDVGVDGLRRAAAAYRSRVIRVRKASSGIQLTPRTNTGSPLTRSVNGVPCVVGRGVQLDGAEADASVASDAAWSGA